MSLLSLIPFFRYKIILKEKVSAAGDDKKRSTDLLSRYDKTKKEWQLGKTKVTLRQLLAAHFSYYYIIILSILYIIPDLFTFVL